jgi:hypothetical protein
MCWAFNHQNKIEMAQAHISLSISAFLVICANTPKSNKRGTNVIEYESMFENWSQMKHQ